MNAKTAIAHRALRPLIGLIDPENVRSIPPNVVACSGLDVLCHGLESYTAIPFHQRQKPENLKDLKNRKDLPGPQARVLVWLGG